MAVGGRGGATDRGWGPRVFLLRYRHARSRLRAGNRTPEPGGLTTLEAQRLIRELGGLDFVGADLVEVSPPLDTSGSPASVPSPSCSDCRARGTADPPARRCLLKSALMAVNTVQEDHDLADRLLLGPGGRDAAGSYRADAVHLPQAIRLRLDDVEHLVAEGAQELLRIDRTNAADHCRGEVLLDALDRCRRGGLERTGDRKSTRLNSSHSQI